jgi:predicted ATPase
MMCDRVVRVSRPHWSGPERAGHPAARPLVLTGLGGAGKTRLAPHVAANAGDHDPDEVFFVAVTPVPDPALVAATIAQPLGLREATDRPLRDRRAENLRDRELFLVLDCFDPLLAVAALVGELPTRMAARQASVSPPGSRPSGTAPAAATGSSIS